VIVGLVAANFCLNVFSQTCLKKSAIVHGVKQIFIWQVAGNFSGFLGVLIFTALLRYLPLAVAFPVIQGVAVIGVQLIAARIFFKEKITLVQWLGTALVIAGILLISIPDSGGYYG
jgi:undecaprenyl phosphate-alpha-L-ara4N flippase subunit ArnE